MQGRLLPDLDFDIFKYKYEFFKENSQEFIAKKYLEEFKNSEKQQLFDLMNSATLPQLTKNDTTFSSKERANEVLEKLTKLAMADGELEGVEKEFIEKVKSLIG